MPSWNKARLSPRQRTLLVLLSGLLTLPGILLPAAEGARPAQQTTQPEKDFSLRARVDLVKVEVTVTDAHGNFLRHLIRENFRILDEGAEQPITHFAAVEAPARVLVLVETSPAVYLIHREHLLAAYALLEGLAADDWVALGTYDQSPHLALEFTQDKSALYQALSRLRYNLGMAELNLFDGLSAALDWLAPVPGKKAIVLLATGLDTSPAGRWDSLVQKLRSSGVAIFAVALGGDLRQVEKEKKREPPQEPLGEAPLSFERAQRVLEDLAQLTGGRAYFPHDPRTFASIYRQLASALRNQYSLGFQPPARDARFHQIEVQVLDARGRILAPTEGAGGYRIHARPGYLAPAP